MHYFFNFNSKIGQGPDTITFWNFLMEGKVTLVEVACWQKIDLFYEEEGKGWELLW